jgi:hypothetical protein
MRIGTKITSPGGLIEASVMVSGQAQQLYRHEGQVWVAGMAGYRYSILVKNQAPGRIEIVSSVDGRNTLRDEAAGHGSTGMVVGSHQSWDCDGFRRNDDEVSAFVFTDPGRAVASQAGAPENVGVLGLAAWREKSKPVPVYDSYAVSGFEDSPVIYKGGGLQTRLSAGVAMAGAGGFEMRSASAAPDLGTGIGETLSSKVGRTSFTRDGSADTITIRYASEESLREQGITGDLEADGPRAFPADDTGYGKYDRVR